MKNFLLSNSQTFLLVFLCILCFYEILCIAYTMNIFSRGIAMFFRLFSKENKIFFTTILVLLILLLIYLIRLKRYYLKANVSLNCSQKISVEDYQSMIRHNTHHHVEKLVNSNEFKSYIQKKLKTQTQNFPKADYTSSDEVRFSDED